MKRIALSLSLLALLGACSSIGPSGSTVTSRSGAASSLVPLIPNKAIQLTATTSVSYATVAMGLAMAVAIYVVYDPLAPNWELEESRLNEDTYRFSMKMKRHHTGGAGESIQVLKRRASQLQYEQGFGGYQILEYTEGIDSQTFGARRVAEGTFKLVQHQQANSFSMNGR